MFPLLIPLVGAAISGFIASTWARITSRSSAEKLRKTSRAVGEDATLLRDTEAQNPTQAALGHSLEELSQAGAVEAKLAEAIPGEITRARAETPSSDTQTIAKIDRMENDLKQYMRGETNRGIIVGTVLGFLAGYGVSYIPHA